jgi:hypothetical protein
VAWGTGVEPVEAAGVAPPRLPHPMAATPTSSATVASLVKELS